MSWQTRCDVKGNYMTERLGQSVGPPVTRHQFEVLTCSTLQNLCKRWQLSTQGCRDELLEKLTDGFVARYQQPLGYDELTVEALRFMCVRARVSTTGITRKEQYIARLAHADQAAAAAAAAEESWREDEQQQTAPTPPQQQQQQKEEEEQQEEEEKLGSESGQADTETETSAHDSDGDYNPDEDQADSGSDTEVRTGGESDGSVDSGCDSNRSDSTLEHVDDPEVAAPQQQQKQEQHNRPRKGAREQQHARQQPADGDSTSTSSSTDRHERQERRHPAKKVALCVGVSDYPTSPLHNAAKDASDLAAALTARGVQVHLLVNPTAQDLTAAIDDFCSTTITQRTELAVFFFAGHGAVCASGDSALLGQHLMMASCWDSTPYTSFAEHASRHGYAVEDLVTKLETSRSKRNLLLIDACRSQVRMSPHPDLLRAMHIRALAAFEQQLAATDTLDNAGVTQAPEWAVEREHDRLHQSLRDDRSTIVCYACRNLGTASDGRQEENGVYTAVLLRHLFSDGHPNLFRAVCAANREAERQSRGQQKPLVEMSAPDAFEHIKL